MKALMMGALCAVSLGPNAAGAAPTSTRAGAPSPIPAMQKALTGAARYQLDIAQGAIADVPASWSTVVVLGTGRAARVYVTVALVAKGKTVRVQEYVSGSTLCRRLGTTGRFTCTTSAAEAAKVTQGLDPTRLLIRPGVAVTFTPMAAKTVGGRSCDGYGVVSRFNTGKTSRSTLYVAHGSSLPCELDSTIRLTTSETSSNGKQTTVETARLQMIWSRFGDPGLAIPDLPGVPTP